MSNAKEEFLEHISEVQVKVKAAVVSKNYLSLTPDTEKLSLKVEYSTQDFENFIGTLDFYYDSGYGCQELFGIIWYEDGSWSSREGYDGSEWWKYNVPPDIPNFLRGE